MIHFYIFINQVFYKTKVSPFVTINELHKQYGPVFTLWFGTSPAVVIGDYDLVRTAFNSKDNQLMGRMNTSVRDFFNQGKGCDIVLTDYGHVFAALRQVAHSVVK